MKTVWKQYNYQIIAKPATLDIYPAFRPEAEDCPKRSEAPFRFGIMFFSQIEQNLPPAYEFERRINPNILYHHHVLYLYILQAAVSNNTIET